MKYTRYDLKANKKKNEWKTMPILIIMVCILAIVIGTLIFKLVYPKVAPKDVASGIINKNQSNEENKTPPIAVESPKEKVNNNLGVKEEFLTVQFGYYSSKENAEKVKSEVGESAAIIKDGEKYRVIGYIGKEEKINKYIEAIKNKGLESSKGKFYIPSNEVCDKKIIEITNGLLEIIDKTKDDSVKSVKTDEFKAWVEKLEVCKECKNSENLEVLKNEVKNLPEAISKSNIENSYQIIFNLLNKFK